MESPSHTYTADGAYNVTLVARNSLGQSDLHTVSIEVKAPPAFTPTIVESSFEGGDSGKDFWRNLFLRRGYPNYI